MTEGKLTLPVIYALRSTNNEEMYSIARKVKNHDVTPEEIKQLVEFTKANGGIEYAEKVMADLHDSCNAYISENVSDPYIRESLYKYVEFVIQRTK